MKFIKIIFVLLILAVIAVSGFSYWVYSSVNASREHSKAAEYIKIEKGTSPRDIISQLADAGIVASPAATMLYLRTVGDASKLQAGEYQFPSPINTLQVL